MSARVILLPLLALSAIVFCVLAYVYGRAVILTLLIVFGYFWLLHR
jgi:hypothetical protein